MGTSKATYTVTRSTHVEAPPETVQALIVDLRRWQAWSPWEDLDPQLQRTYGGADAGVGAWYEWRGNRKAGQGRMEIVEASDRHVTIDLRFVKPFRSESTTRFDLTSDAGATLVTWTMTGPQTVASRLMGIFTSMDRMIGPDFEKGLARLKTTAEDDAAGPA
ncbi:SRPBCC family protein [Nitriliruptor alkaliphilus]|uniref:SRPBCC family protein n=1 Tax=Nitriliruptor alkaliphilus TaxID=427918 RepID=UPI0006961EF8|nr:SRPBCC family protein [Nitriliruptor alkaliphilus]